ncbi:MAG: methionyl-tRNA formyltransferase [Chloroflexia bacterium]
MFASMGKLRIVYFSSRPSDLTNVVVRGLEAAGAEILLVVMTPGPRARPTEAYKDVVANKLSGVDVLVTSHMARLASMLRELEPDLIFVTGFPWRLPAELLALPRLGSVNTHPALLPKYRGPNPLFWQILNDERETGLTIHRMETEFDTGPILAQGVMSIDPDWYIEDLAGHLGDVAPKVLREGLAAAVAGDPGRPQPTQGASYAPLTTEADRKLDWARPAAESRNRVRAWGMEGAVGQIEGREWIVRRARVVEDRGEGGKAGVGSLVDLGPEGRAVRTGEGMLLLEDAEEVGSGERGGEGVRVDGKA